MNQIEALSLGLLYSICRVVAIELKEIYFTSVRENQYANSTSRFVYLCGWHILGHIEVLMPVSKDQVL